MNCRLHACSVWSVVLAVVVGMCLAGTAAAQSVFTPKDVATLSYVGSVAVAPDGKHVAYTKIVQRNPLEDENGSAWVELHVADRAGKSRPFITGKVNVSAIQWTPDGGGIAFQDFRSGREALATGHGEENPQIIPVGLHTHSSPSK